MHLFDDYQQHKAVFLQHHSRTVHDRTIGPGGASDRKTIAGGASDGETMAGVTRDGSIDRGIEPVRDEVHGIAVRGSYQTGLFGEEVVADGLRRAGWRVLGHRVRTKWGELDVIARKGDTVIFAEVKTSRRSRAELGELIPPRAQHRLRRAAVAWMSSNPRLHRGVRRYRFDVFLVRQDPRGGIERIDHLRNAF